MDMQEWVWDKYQDKAELFDALAYIVLPKLSDEQLREIFAEELKEESENQTSSDD